MMNRSLDRHSVNTDNQLHLAALASFARSNASTSDHIHSAKEFLSHAQGALSTLNRFLNGDSGDEVMSLMREQIPQLRDDLRKILEDLDGALQNSASTVNIQELRIWLEFAVHVEALVFALFPKQWDRLNVGPGNWELPEVFRSNAYWVREGLREAEKLYSVWQAL